MSKYNQVGKGAAFVRDKTSSKQPDFGGTVTLNDNEYLVSLWKSRTKKGDPYLSIQFSERVDDDADTSGPCDKESKE